MRPSNRRFSLKLSDGDLKRLHVFQTVTRCGGFAAAESQLQMGLPSISRCIKDLEIRIGARLCRRGPVGFELTEHGRQIYEASLQLHEDLKRFEATVSNMHSSLSGVVNIGIVDALITDPALQLPRIVKAYRQRHPNVELNVQTRPTGSIEQALLDATLQAGLILARRRINQLDYHVTHPERNYLYCSEDHPLFAQEAITAGDLSRYDYAGYSFSDATNRSGPTSMMVKAAWADSVEAMATLISSGCFIGMLPEHYVDSIWRLKGFRCILPKVFCSTINFEFVVRRGEAAPRVMALRDIVMQTIETSFHKASVPPALSLVNGGATGFPQDAGVGLHPLSTGLVSGFGK